MKLLLRKTTNDRTLRVDELQTLLFEAAAVMKSRPLCPIETHSDDGVEPLTPALFLAGGLLTSLPVDASPSTHYTYSRAGATPRSDGRSLEALEKGVPPAPSEENSIKDRVSQPGSRGYHFTKGR